MLTAPRAYSFILGGLSVLALAPFEFLPILLLTFPLFFKTLNHETKTKKFWLGWWFGFGYFVFGLYWISNSLLVDAEKFAWMIPFAIAGIPSVLAFYIAITAWVYGKLKSKFNEIGQVILFISLWVVAEIARNYLFTGFPWNSIGYASLFALPLAHIAAYGGVFLASFVVLLIAFLPLLYRSKIALLAIALALGLGSYSYLFEESSGKGLKVRLVQPSVEQSLKWIPELKAKQLVETMELAGQGDANEFDFIIWPEAGVPFHLNRNPQIIEKIAEITPKDGYSIVGSLRSEGDNSETYKIWNSIYIINADAEIVAIYDKRHLVPFGEYVPFRDALPVDKITPGQFDISSGLGPEILQVDDWKMIPLICYEVIFPRYSAVENGDFILNITNDGWFGDSTGPHQHLAMARMRAIEQGKPVFRAANNGISAIISSKGEVLDSLHLNKRAVLDYSFSY